MPSLVSFNSDPTQPRDDDAPTAIGFSTSTSSPTLSLGAMIGIVVSGSVILFTVLSSLLHRVARWQDGRHNVATNQDGLQHYPFDGQIPPPPSGRLRKRNRVAENMATLRSAGVYDGIGKRIPLPVLPPVFARRESFHLNPFAAADEAQWKEREEAREMCHLREGRSWIDENALPGPRVTTPEKKGEKRASHGISWFRTGPAPTMSSRQTAGNALGGTTTCIGIPSTDTTMPIPASVLKPPSAVIYSVRHRNRALPCGVQILSGNARLPSTYSQISNASVTDTELAEILRMKAERLWDRNWSSRRQMPPVRDAVRSSGSSNGDRTSSAAKSQGNAPGVLTCAALESNEMAVYPSEQQNSGQTPVATPRHDRRVLQLSMISEPDSLMAMRRISQPGLQTSLSSPNRTNRAAELMFNQGHPELTRSLPYSKDGEQDTESRKGSNIPDQDMVAMLRSSRPTMC